MIIKYCNINTNKTAHINNILGVIYYPYKYNNDINLEKDSTWYDFVIPDIQPILK